ncbi:zinc finger domain-containing protein [Saccharopolyspora sp. NPDC002376]
MNRDDVLALMGVAAAIDPTMPAYDEDVVAVWVAMLEDVPARVAEPAVHGYYRSDAYREHRRSITPADVFGYYKSAKRDYLERRHTTEIANQRAAIAAAPQPVGSLAERFARIHAERTGRDPDVAEAEAGARRQLLAVACSYCKAREHHECTSYNGRPLQKIPAHPSRIDAAVNKQHS